MAKITIIFLLYNAQGRVAALVESALKQRHPDYIVQSDWLEVFLMDDCSRDHTLSELHAALAMAGPPPHFTVIANSQNLGLSKTLNKAFGLIRTPYGLTCHLDVMFGSDDYVANMLTLMENHPLAGAITGQPQIPPLATMLFAEKLNVVTNLMDIFPRKENGTLLPVGFAEGRCDIFRMEALETTGFWDGTLHASGEDQVLAARMREKGYEIYQAPHLAYFLSVSDEQNNLVKLLRHSHLFGRTQPYILFRNRRAFAGVTGPTAGTNRQLRLFLRLTHIVASFIYVFVAFSLFFVQWWLCAALLLILVSIKFTVMRKHLSAVRLSLSEWPLFLLFVPLQDICYTVGFLQGLRSCACASRTIK